VAVEGGRRWERYSAYGVGDLMGGKTGEGNASPWVCQAMVNGSQMSKLGLQHQALVCMHKNSLDVEADTDTLPPSLPACMHTCLLLDSSILLKYVLRRHWLFNQASPLPSRASIWGGDPNSFLASPRPARLSSSPFNKRGHPRS